MYLFDRNAREMLARDTEKGVHPAVAKIEGRFPVPKSR